MLPVVETVQGGLIKQGMPSLVFFTMLDPAMAYETVALATAWQKRHPGVQVILVDTRSNPEDVRAWVRREGVTVAVIADEDDAFEEAFDTNRLPILYLLDERGIIQDKIAGNSLERFIELDQVLSWAAAGDWDSVAAQRSEWLTVGEVPRRSLADVPLGQGAPTIVYHTSPFCDLCQRIVEEGLQEQLNAVAGDYPEVNFIILQIADTFDFEAFRGQVETFTALYGRAALPDVLLLAVERGRLPDVPAVPLPLAGWAENIRLINYTSHDANDPQRWWGQPLTPALMLFDSQGAYQGPLPIWEGPYSAQALEQVIRGFLELAEQSENE